MAYMDELGVGDRVSFPLSAVTGSPDVTVEGVIDSLLPGRVSGSAIPDPTRDAVLVRLDNGTLARLHPLYITIIDGDDD